MRAWSWKMTDENMLPCSVIAIAGIFSSTALSSSSSIRQAPSSSEYSECRWRWTNSDNVEFLMANAHSMHGGHSHSIVDGGFELMS